MKAVNILWDTDNEEDLDFLPDEIEIPDSLADCEDEDIITDFLTDLTGFCLYGYDLE